MARRLSEHTGHALDALSQYVDLGTGIVQTKGGTHGTKDAQAVYEGLGTVVTGTHRDAFLIEQLSHFRG